MKKITFIFAMLLIACGGSGTLYSPPGLNYYDFNYDATKAQTVASLTSNTTTLTYNFVWDGVAGQNITTPQHAVVAMTQIASPTTTLNQTGQMIWTHRAGALVGARGLALELWFRNDVNGNGYLSLAEVDKGVRDVLQCDRLFHTKPVLIRAFESAKGCDATSGATYGHEYVGRRRNDGS